MVAAKASDFEITEHVIHFFYFGVPLNNVSNPQMMSTAIFDMHDTFPYINEKY